MIRIQDSQNNYFENSKGRWKVEEKKKKIAQDVKVMRETKKGNNRKEKKR